MHPSHSPPSCIGTPRTSPTRCRCACSSCTSSTLHRRCPAPTAAPHCARSGPATRLPHRTRCSACAAEPFTHPFPNPEFAMLHMQAVAKVYRTELVETHALRSLDLHVKEGEFVAVTGPSGSGKTTFLNIAGLLETFTGGEYRLESEDARSLTDEARPKLRNQQSGSI